MKKILLCLFLLLVACNHNSANKISGIPIKYNLNEPTVFPFIVDHVYTEIDISNPKLLHQFIFHYTNSKTYQKIKYVFSKNIKNPDAFKYELVSKQNDIKEVVLLNNGIEAYCFESPTIQAIWWGDKQGGMHQFIYYIDEATQTLNSNNKLNISDLISLANQIQ